jgi:hypothetical protein
MNQINLQQLRNVLINGKFPSKIVEVKGILFEFICTDDDISLCNNVPAYVEIFSKVIKCKLYNNNIVQFIDLPGAYLRPISNAYFEFQSTTLKILLDSVAEFIKSAESYGLWLTYKHSDASYVLSINNCKLNLIQRRWVALNAVKDADASMKMIADIFDSVKPWLDKELYVKIKESEEGTRENAFFNDDTYDTKLREKAKRLAGSAQKNNAETESDIITIEEEH